MMQTKKSLAISVTLALFGSAIVASSIGCSAPYAAPGENAESSGDSKNKATTTTSTTPPPPAPAANTPIQSIPATPPPVADAGPGVNDTCVGCPSGFICSAGQCITAPTPTNKCGSGGNVTCPTGFVCSPSTGQCVQPKRTNNNQACFDQCIQARSFEAADYVQCTTINCAGVPGLCDDDCFAQMCGGFENECDQALQTCDALCGF